MRRPWKKPTTKAAIRKLETSKNLAFSCPI